LKFELPGLEWAISAHKIPGQAVAVCRGFVLSFGASDCQKAATWIGRATGLSYSPQRLQALIGNRARQLTCSPGALFGRVRPRGLDASYGLFDSFSFASSSASSLRKSSRARSDFTSGSVFNTFGKSQPSLTA